ncbi:uncharacterized protein LOC130378857 [Gadus chalcogrammus]|uniref:uncharacterized protein LOC130378857 n=1 Tax=Gadus chalcogrammus TaxID=1042646 RepID=UPI0024C235C2|nr:uncharacterized protein LOC130378857 [Gadus chalcogrammus]
MGLKTGSRSGGRTPQRAAGTQGAGGTFQTIRARRGDRLLISPMWSYQVLPLKHLARSAFELHAVTVTIPIKLSIVVIYRPPGPFRDFYDEMDALLSCFPEDGTPRLGEFHHLLQELRLDDGRFQRYFRLSRAKFDDLLARVGARISRQDTNYRRSISASERLSVRLRTLAHALSNGPWKGLYLADEDAPHQYQSNSCGVFMLMGDMLSIRRWWLDSCETFMLESPAELAGSFSPSPSPHLSYTFQSLSSESPAGLAGTPSSPSPSPHLSHTLQSGTTEDRPFLPT